MALTQLLLPPGLERNNTPYETTDRWWDCNLVRWQSGSMMPVGGNQRVTSSALTGTVRAIHVYANNSDVKHMLVGTDSHLYYENAGAYTSVSPGDFTPLTDIGPGGGFGTGTFGTSTWGTARAAAAPTYDLFAYYSFGQWGEDVIWTANSDGRLFYLTSASGAVTTVAGATTSSTLPSDIRGLNVSAERHLMVAGATFGGTHYPHRVAWASREAYNDWDFTSVTNTAGYEDLTTQSPLRRLVTVREGQLIFSDSDVFMAEYIGQPFIYKFSNIAKHALKSPMSIATFNGQAVWLTRTGFKIYSGGAISDLPCPILNDIFESMDTANGGLKMFGAHNGAFPEVWWFWPSTDETECDRCAYWNYAENWWGWGSLSRSAMAPGEVYRRPYMGSSAGHVYEHELGWLDDGVTRVGDIWVESGALDLNGGANTLEINQAMMASGHGAAVMKATFYTRRTPEGSERTFGPYSNRSDGYMDTRVSGRHARIRVANAADSDWAVSKILLDVEQGGER